MGVNIRIASSFALRARGLIGRPRCWLGDDGVLLLTPCSSVHTFFMHHSIDVAFIDAEGVVISSFRNVAENRFLFVHKAAATLERFSKFDADWLEAGEQLMFFK